MFLKIAPLCAAAFFSVSAFAAETTIQVTAEVDPLVYLLQADGSPLPQKISMTAEPTATNMAHVLLKQKELKARVYSNVTDKPINISLKTEPVLKEANDKIEAIALSVKVGDLTLTTTPKTLSIAQLDMDASSGASKDLNVVISQKDKDKPIKSAGSYTGNVQMILSVAASST